MIGEEHRAADERRENVSMTFEAMNNNQESGNMEQK